MRVVLILDSATSWTTSWISCLTARRRTRLRGKSQRTILTSCAIRDHVIIASTLKLGKRLISSSGSWSHLRAPQSSFLCKTSTLWTSLNWLATVWSSLARFSPSTAPSTLNLICNSLKKCSIRPSTLQRTTLSQSPSLITFSVLTTMTIEYGSAYIRLSTSMKRSSQRRTISRSWLWSRSDLVSVSSLSKSLMEPWAERLSGKMQAISLQENLDLENSISL